ILIYRRRTNTRVFGATTAGDKLMYLFLAATILFGVLATVVETAFGTYDYREGVSIWFRNFWTLRDRKSTRLNSSHVSMSYAVFCLKKKKNRLRGGRAPGRHAVR